jgi:hypothetical protein
MMLIFFPSNCFYSFLSFVQNVVINVTEPEQPLEVGGIVFTNQGGLRFSDTSLQATVAELPINLNLILK